MTAIPTGDIVVRRLAGAAEITALRDLRARVLRPGRPPEATYYPSDVDPAVIHLGAFAGPQCVGVASLYPEDGIRLRGMAVDPAWQRRGIGAALIRQAQQIATAAGQDLWANARDTAAGFYAGLGWVAEGAGFVTESGPHHVMRWRVPRDA
ncbi:MAG TPA: GNAT family N-acetyltransferase [Chloroflexia bacterium]|nr:GNAT family N-acetyltransferase [Chloroflexia bacterium]